MVTKIDLHNQLVKQFDLICFEDLADYQKTHRAIFDLFKRHHRDKFENTQRLVLYSSYALEQEFINHIQRAASRIDISNFFIMLVTPFEIVEQLQIANKLHGNDNNIIQYIVVNLADTTPFTSAGFLKNISSVCALPFMSLLANTNTNIMPCCKFDRSETTVTGRQPLLEIFHGDEMKNLRAQMKQGIKPIECRVCWDAESKNTTSQRNHAMTKFGDRLDQEWADNPQLTSLELSLSNLCNFNCRICNSTFSSRIALEEIKHTQDQNKKQYLKERLNINKESADWESLGGDAVFRNIEQLHIMGGEPFKWKQLPVLLEKLIDCNYAKNITIEFNTNGSVYPNRVIELLHQFRSVEILISVDDIGTRFEIQRGGQWEEILYNLKLFHQLKSTQFSVKISPTVNIQNLLYLDQLVNFCNTMEFDIVWCYLETPDYFCIDNTTQQVKDIVWEKYSQHTNPELRAIATRVVAGLPGDATKFLYHVQQYDQRRFQSFKSVHPEIFDAMSC
jgi:molybdenum cofactor biosynthesis enzyme MoaA